MCDIASLQVSGQDFSAQGIPTQLRVEARVDCSAVNIEVRRNATDPTPILSATNVQATPASQPVPGTPPNLVVQIFPLTGGLSITCGDLLHVTIACTNDASCRRDELALVQCKGFVGSECPATVVLSVAPPLDQSADCVAAGAYVVTVVDPVGSDITYFWSAGAVGSPQSSLPGTGPTQTVQVQDGDPQTIVSVIAIKTGCAPAPPGTVLFPAGDDVQCPTGFTVIVAQGTTVLAGPHTNVQGVDWNVPALAAGTYTVRVTQPSGSGESYEWFNNDGTLAATGPANDHTATISAGQSTTLSFRIKPSDCCPAMMGSVTLTGSTSGTPPSQPPDTETPVEQPPVTEPATPASPFCAFLNLLVGLALIAVLLSVVASGCLMLLPTAIPTLLAAAAVAIVAGLLWLLICGPDLCLLVGVLVWTLKWAIVLGALIAIGCSSFVSAFIVVLYGGIVAALIWVLIARGCRIPRLLGPP